MGLFDKLSKVVSSVSENASNSGAIVVRNYEDVPDLMDALQKREFIRARKIAQLVDTKEEFECADGKVYIRAKDAENFSRYLFIKWFFDRSTIAKCEKYGKEWEELSRFLQTETNEMYSLLALDDLWEGGILNYSRFRQYATDAFNNHINSPRMQQTVNYVNNMQAQFEQSAREDELKAQMEAQQKMAEETLKQQRILTACSTCNKKATCTHPGAPNFLGSQCTCHS